MTYERQPAPCRQCLWQRLWPAGAHRRSGATPLARRGHGAGALARPAREHSP